jgi:hypothetical protein
MGTSSLMAADLPVKARPMPVEVELDWLLHRRQRRLQLGSFAQ